MTSGPRPVRLCVVGDVLLDRDVDGHVERLCPDAPVPVVDSPAERCRPGGAGLAALLAAADGHEVVLVTALGEDAAAERVLALLDEAGVATADVGTGGTTPVKTRVRADGRPLLRLDEAGDAPAVRLSAAARQALTGAATVLVADYGRGVAAARDVRAAVAAAGAVAPVVWDPHPRGPAPVAGVRVATPNLAETVTFVPGSGGDGLTAIAARAARLAERWGATGVAVTMAERGALYLEGEGPPLVTPAPTVSGGDPCGAGDRFSATLAARLAAGALPSEAVADAVAAASAFVASGGAGALAVASGDVPAGASRRRRPPAVELAGAVRARGGTVVATGGCFDLLHAGHVALLEAARRLGDCLVVCLNSDESVRRLKGPGRPIVPAGDRAAVLGSLGCVDAVEVFDEDTPGAALERIRPHVWAKGSDYAGAALPEAEVLRRWGGQAVVLPYLRGRSTTRLVKEVVNRAER